MLLKMGGKAILVRKDMAEPWPSVLWKAELVSKQIEYLAEEIFKHSTK